MSMERILGVASVVPVNHEEPRSYRVTLLEAVVEILGIKKGDKVVYVYDEKLKLVYIKKA
jgi:hypothetical protein